jgi:hypothetical protein
MRNPHGWQHPWRRTRAQYRLGPRPRKKRWGWRQFINPVLEEVTVGAYRDKQVRPSAEGIRGKDPVDPTWAKKRPALHEFISEITSASGTAMKAATLMLFAEDSSFKVVLHDRQGECNLWCTGETIEGLLDALEKRLVSGTAEWRKDRPLPGKGRRG